MNHHEGPAFEISLPAKIPQKIADQSREGHKWIVRQIGLHLKNTGILYNITVKNTNIVFHRG